MKSDQGQASDIVSPESWIEAVIYAVMKLDPNLMLEYRTLY